MFFICVDLPVALLPSVLVLEEGRTGAEEKAPGYVWKSRPNVVVGDRTTMDVLSFVCSIAKDYFWVLIKQSKYYSLCPSAPRV